MHTDPLPQQARAELERLGVRWQQLPLARALRVLPEMRAAAQRFADATARAAGRSPADLPDLGPATAYDQLVVTAYDACLAGLHRPHPPHEAPALDVEADLTHLRRVLADA